MARVTVVAAATVAVLTLTACTVEIVDDGRSGPALTAGTPASAPPSSRTPEVGESDEPVAPEPADDATSEPAPDDADGPGLPSREDLLPLTTAQTACGGGELTRDRAGDAVQVTDACGTLTVGGTGSVVVAGDVTHLVVTGSGAQVALQRVATVTITASSVTVTWEDGSPSVTDEGPGNTYGAVDAR